jgi:peptidoglycan/xylan/chitin deacetylase (PgdA/CDA1 family)
VSVVAIARAAAPEPLRERARLLLARRLEVRLRRSAAVRGAAIVWHAVGPRAGDDAHEIDPPLQLDRLDAAVGYLARRYILVHAADLPSAAHDRRPGARLPVAITFDDDLPSHRVHAAPLLARHGVTATAFLCGARSPFWWQELQLAVDTGAIGPEELPHLAPALVAQALERRPGALGRLAKAIEDLAPAKRDDVAAVLRRAAPAVPPPLGPEGAAALAAAGWEIGFHTRRHDLLPVLGDDALREALRWGPEDGMLTAARTLAFPHGKATGREASAAREAGFTAAYTGRPEVVTEKTDVHLIGRLQPDTATLGRFALSLARALSAP